MIGWLKCHVYARMYDWMYLCMILLNKWIKRNLGCWFCLKISEQEIFETHNHTRIYLSKKREWRHPFELKYFNTCFISRELTENILNQCHLCLFFPFSPILQLRIITCWVHDQFLHSEKEFNDLFDVSVQ